MRPATLFALMMASVLGIGLFGCDKKPASGGPTAVSEVRLGYFANVTHAQAVLGVSSGEFEKAIAPARLKTNVFNAGPSLIEALFAGQIDIGYVGPGPALSAQVQSRGQGIRVISGAAANGVLIVAQKDPGIKTLADLKGRKIATPQTGNTQDISARHYVTAELKQADASNVMAVPNAEQAALMSRGDIDAAWAPEPWGSRLMIETGATLVGEEKDLWKDGQFTMALVITTPEFLRDHPDVVEKMLRVHCAWTQRLSENPQAYAQQLGEALTGLTGKKLPAGVLESAVRNVKFTNDPLDETLRTMAQWSYDLRVVDRPAQLDGLVDLTILKKVQGK